MNLYSQAEGEQVPRVDGHKRLLVVLAVAVDEAKIRLMLAKPKQSTGPVQCVWCCTVAPKP